MTTFMKATHIQIVKLPEQVKPASNTSEIEQFKI